MVLKACNHPDKKEHDCMLWGYFCITVEPFFAFFLCHGNPRWRIQDGRHSEFRDEDVIFMSHDVIIK